MPETNQENIDNTQENQLKEQGVSKVFSFGPFDPSNFCSIF